jgi:glycerophosphoryl diester phosphodiesterase
MINLIKDSLKDFRKSYRKLFLFAVIYMFISSLIFVPMIASIFNRMLRIMGSNYLLNSDVYNITLSYKVFLSIVAISILSLYILYIEFSVFLIIAQKVYFNKKISIADAFITSIRKTSKLLGLGVLHFIPILLIIAPFFSSTIAPSMLLSINVRKIITNRVFDTYYFTIIYFLFLFLGIYLILRWIFTLHFILIEGMSIKDSLKYSLSITKRNKVKILFTLLLANTIVIFIAIVVSASITYIPSVMTVRNTLLERYLITFSSFLTYIFTMLLMPINTIFITRLYYKIHKERNIILNDNLKVYSSKLLNSLEKFFFKFFRLRKGLLFSLFLIYITGSFLLNYTLTKDVLRWNVMVIGHRGDMYNAPENSMSSVISAINIGVDAVEIDVQMTKDGIIVLNHDFDLKRVAGVPFRVSDLTYDEISKLEIGAHFSEQFLGERIPTLLEVLLEVKGKTKLVIEIKPYGPSSLLAEKVVELIEELDMVDQCYIQSFEYAILKEVRKLNSDIKIAQILYVAAGNLSALDVDIYTINQSMLSHEFIKNAQKNGRKVWVWTVNNERNIRDVLRYDIDGIITGYPEMVRNALVFNQASHR